MTDKEALKPCPFCGGEGGPLKGGPNTDRDFPIVRCGGCYAEVCGENGDRGVQSAIKAWNHRPAEEALAQERDELLIEKRAAGWTKTLKLGKAFDDVMMHYLEKNIRLTDEAQELRGREAALRGAAGKLKGLMSEACISLDDGFNVSLRQDILKACARLATLGIGESE